MNPQRRVLVTKLVSMGDCIVCTPVIRALRQQYPRPDWELTVLTTEPFVEIWAGNPHIDRLKAIPPLTGIWNQGLALYAYDAATTAELQRERYDVLAELNLLTHWGEYRRSGKSLCEFYLAMAGCWPCDDLHYEIPCNPTVEHERLREACPEVAEQIEMFGDAASLILIHGGGGWGLKVLPEHLWIPIVRALSHDGDIVFVGGPGDRISSALQEDLGCQYLARNTPVRDLSGQLGIKTLYYLMTKSKLFIGADSGPMHLASAANCRTVAYYSVTSQFVGSPISDRFVTVQSEASCDAPCGLVQCRTHELCVKLIDPEHLITAARHVLSGDEPAQQHWKGDRPCFHVFHNWEHLSMAYEHPPLAEWLKQRPMLDPNWSAHA